MFNCFHKNSFNLSNIFKKRGKNRQKCYKVKQTLYWVYINVKVKGHLFYNIDVMTIKRFHQEVKI